MLPKPILLGGLALALSGCVHYEAQPISPAATARERQARTLADDGLTTFFTDHHTPLPAARWELSDLTLAAFYFNPELEIARTHWATITAGEITAQERPNPALGISPGLNTSTPSNGPSAWILGLNIDFPIETAGKRSHRLTHSRQLSAISRLAIASVAWQTRLAVRRAMVEIEAAETEVDLRAEQLAAETKAVAILEARFNAGESTANEVSRERIALAQTQLAANAAQQRAAINRSALAAALGVPTSAIDTISLSFDQLHLADSADIELSAACNQALTTRADVLAALADYAASEAALQLAVARQYPDIHLGPGYEFDQGDHKWSLGFGWELPVFHRQQGPIAEAAAQRSESAARFNAVQARALAEVEQAFASYRAAQSNVITADTITASATQQKHRLDAIYATGEVPVHAVYAAAVESASARLAQLEAHTAFQLALSDLEAAVQNPSTLNARSWE